MNEISLISAFLILLISPILLIRFKNKATFFKNILFVLLGKKTIVGYQFNQDSNDYQLPKIKSGILFPSDKSEQNSLASDKLNLIYARDYSIQKDLSILKNAWRKLGRK